MRVMGLVLILLLLAGGAHAYPNFVPSGYAYDPPDNDTCRNCHSSYPLNSGDGTFSSDLPDAWEPGESYTIHLVLTDNVTRAGFQATFKDMSNQFAGQVYVVDAQHTQLSGTYYINQTSSGTYTSSNGGEWDIGWTAPAAGTGDIRFCISAAACNGTGGTSGDHIYGWHIIIPEATQDPYGLTITPIVDTVPASGGNITYSVEFFTDLPNPFNGVNYWTTVTMPDGAETGRLFFITANIPPYADIYIPLMAQEIPSYAPAGTYTHNAKMGNYPMPVLMDSFTFSKSATGTDAEPVTSWTARGDWAEVTGEESQGVDIAAEFALKAAYPNPFNAATRVSVTLPETADLDLLVYNVMGEVVADLHHGVQTAGAHSYTLDGTNLSSGLYFVQAIVPGKLNQIQKVTLLK